MDEGDAQGAWGSPCPTHLLSRCFNSRLARHRKIVEPEVVGESDSEVEGEAWRVEREDTSEEEEEEVDDEVQARRRRSSYLPSPYSD